MSFPKREDCLLNLLDGSVAEINLATGARYNWLTIIASQVKLTDLQSIRGHTFKGKGICFPPTARFFSHKTSFFFGHEKSVIFNYLINISH
jgi:hypothetical protein